MSEIIKNKYSDEELEKFKVLIENLIKIMRFYIMLRLRWTTTD